VGQRTSSRGVPLSKSERLEVLERVASGERQLEIAPIVGCGTTTIQRILSAAGGRPSRRSRRRPRSPLRLSLPEREEIRAGIAAGDSFHAIARRIGRAPSTIGREVGGVAGRARYRATKADDRACLRALRPKRSKLACNPGLRRAVTALLKRRFWPQQISARLKLEYPHDEELRIAPETVYQSLYVQGRGLLRKDLSRYLRSGRSKRKPVPEHLRQSLTWDRGREMARHLDFTVATGVQVYFCDPHSPWQRGSNENTNGLLRQYFPKGSDLAVHGQVELDKVAAELNGRPRQTLGWQTPAEKMAELLR